MTDYPPEDRPSSLFSQAIDAFRHTRIGGGDPGDMGSYIARWLAANNYVVRSEVPGVAELMAKGGYVAPSADHVRCLHALEHVRNLAGLHYAGGAFEPEHMRVIANLAADALAGRPIPPPVDRRSDAALEAAQRYSSWLESELGPDPQEVDE